MNDNPFFFHPPAKESLLLLRWVLFDYPRLKEYEDTLNGNYKVLLFLRLCFLRIIPIALLITIVSIGIVSFVDFQRTGNTIYLPILNELGVVFIKFFFVINLIIACFLYGVIKNLTIALSISVALALMWNLALIYLSLSICLNLPVNNVFLNITIGICTGLTLHLSREFIKFIFLYTIFITSILTALVTVFTLSILVEGVRAIFSQDLYMLLIMVTWGGVFYFRIPFYIMRFVQSFYQNTLTRNPYLKDANIWIPIPHLDKSLIHEAYYNPYLALYFIHFLIKYRPLQHDLAMHMKHAANAGLISQNPLIVEQLTVPTISEYQKRFIPSEKWLSALQKCKDELLTSEQQSNLHLKADFYEKFIEALKEWQNINNYESPRWNHYYREPIEKWIRLANEELEAIREEAKLQEPISRNQYRAGETLVPDLNKNVFVGREDLRDQLSVRILSPQSMPMYLLQGQRRVGKTSLLRFLPMLLGSRFKVVYMDLQGGIHHPVDWMQKLQIRIQKDLRLKNELRPEHTITDGLNWLSAWERLRNWLDHISENEQCKIIIALDEYEELHRKLQQDAEQAKDLLGAMRSFSQHQNKIVFMFVGANLFSELENPNWGEYFVQATRLRVDYLGKEDTLKLIGVATLDYPDEVKERIFELTQGHPTLVQKICQELVNLANFRGKRQMTMQDLDHVLGTYLVVRDNHTIEVFWNQFCRNDTDRRTALAIADRQPPVSEVPQLADISRKSLARMLEHGFVIEANGRYRMRVPLFEIWVRKFGVIE